MERLSGLDSAFLNAEADNAPMNVLAAVVLEDGAFAEGTARDEVALVLGERLHRIPKLRKREHDVPLGLDHPVWEDDPDFSLDWHIRHVALPSPGGAAELERLLAEIAARPLVRSRPLWEVWVVEGFDGARTVVIFKVHHAVMDGLAGAAALLSLFDPPEGAPDPQTPPARAAPAGSVSSLWLAAESLWSSSLRASVGQFAQAAVWAGGAALGVTRRVLSPFESQETAPVPGEGPDLSFNGVVSPVRDVGFAQVPFEEIRAIQRRHELTVNEAVLSALTQALREELHLAGECPTEALVAAIPVGGDHDAGETGNKVSAMLARLPVHVAEREEQVEIVRQQSRAAKADHEAVGPATLPSVAQYVWPPLVKGAIQFLSAFRLADHLPSPVNLVVSNVPGPPEALCLGGACATAIYPFGPIFDGVGLNVTVLSYAGDLHVGVTAGTESAVDASRLAVRFRACVADLSHPAHDFVAAPGDREGDTTLDAVGGARRQRVVP